MEDTMTTSPTTMTDPVCAMSVDPMTAAASMEHEGQTYYFCSEGCHQSFAADPSSYVTS